jgi:hypothetical protein
MNGRISRELERIIRDPDATVQLRKALTGESDGYVTSNGKTYKIVKIH